MDSVSPNIAHGLFFNAGSLVNKLHDLHDFIYSRPYLPSIIGIVETWLTLDIPDSCLNVQNYSVFRFDRPTRGGGILLLVKNNFTVSNTQCFAFGPIQVLLCDVKSLFSYSKNSRVICIYRPPNCDLIHSQSFFKFLISNLTPLKSDFPVLLMGDFNLTKIDWSSQAPILNHSTADSLLIRTCQKCHLFQKVFSPTHLNNITDLFFESIDNLTSNVVVEMPFSNSDHNTISFEFLSCSNDTHLDRAVPSSSSRLRQLDFSKTDFVGLSAHLLSINWRQYFSLSDNIEVAWNTFSSVFLSLVSKFTPVKKHTYKGLPLPPNILKLIKQKKAAWKFYTKHKSITNRKTFYRLAKTVKASIYAYRTSHEEHILNSRSTKLFYNYARSRIHPVPHLGPLRDSTGNLISSDLGRAELLNSYFQSVYVQDNGMSPIFQSRSDVNLQNPVVSISDVKKSLAAASSSYSCDPDGCPPVLLKKLPELCSPLCDLYNMSLQQGSVPRSWKVANIIPIYKGKGSLLDPKNYRPISLTNVFCKALERIIREKLVNHLESENLISSCQSGFRANHSTLTQLTQAQSFLTNQINQLSCVDAIYTDLSKAFDTISHKKTNS